MSIGTYRESKEKLNEAIENKCPLLPNGKRDMSFAAAILKESGVDLKYTQPVTVS
jgi:hypothetical protein